MTCTEQSYWYLIEKYIFITGHWSNIHTHVIQMRFNTEKNCWYFTDDFFMMICKKNAQFCIFIYISPLFVHQDLIDNKLEFIKVMTWRCTSHKSIAEPMMTKITDAYMRHWASMSSDYLSDRGHGSSSMPDVFIHETVCWSYWLQFCECKAAITLPTYKLHRQYWDTMMRNSPNFSRNILTIPRFEIKLCFLYFVQYTQEHWFICFMYMCITMTLYFSPSTRLFNPPPR